MFYVYILFSVKYNKSYTGFTSNLQQRLLSHNHLSNKDWTKRYRPWILIYSESFESKSEALAREKFLKSGHGRTLVKEIIKQYFDQS